MVGTVTDKASLQDRGAIVSIGLEIEHDVSDFVSGEDSLQVGKCFRSVSGGLENYVVAVDLGDNVAV